MLRKKIVIHLSPLGTESVSIDEYMRGKNEDQTPHFLIGRHESHLTSYSDINWFNRNPFNRFCGVGFLGTYDMQSIHIVVCLPQTKADDINDVEIDDSNNYFELVREMVIMCASDIMDKYPDILVNDIISHEEAYQAGMATRTFSIEHWWNKYYGFYSMDFLRSDIEHYRKYRTLITDYQKYGDGEISKIKNREVSTLADIEKDIYRVVLDNSYLYLDMVERAHNIGCNPVPYKLIDDNKIVIQFSDHYTEAGAIAMAENLNRFGYGDVRITKSKVEWSEEIDHEKRLNEKTPIVES
ncbi:MAG: hypothetical protein PHC62_00025 [Candidatus Izemoplasmatales bacterium]|nr:hypothetical protein [Candidatus Izemoplasmatales bacterium]